MIKKTFIFLALFLSVFANTACTNTAAAANEVSTAKETRTTEQLATTGGTTTSSKTLLEAVINSEDTTAIDGNMIFDASQSYIPNEKEEYKYEWDFGDGNKDQGIEVLHSYKDTGRYSVSLRIFNKKEESITNKEIFVYNKSILVLTDSQGNKALLETIKTYGETKGVFIKIIDSFGASSEFISEEILYKKLSESLSSLQKSSQILTWTRENSGLNALSRLVAESKTKEPLNLSNKSIVVVTSEIEGYSGRIENQFSLLNPKNIILINEAGVYPIIDNITFEDLTKNLQEKGYEYKIVTEATFHLMPWNFLSYFISVLIEKGIPDNTIALILLLPVIATVITFMKQFVGLTTMGIFTPMVITLSFLVIGMNFGLVVLLMILLVGTLVRQSLNKARLLYIPKMAIVIASAAIMLLLLLIVSLYFDSFNASFLSISIFPMVILSTLVERFISIKTERGLKTAIVLMTETVIVSIIAYIVVGGSVDIGIVSFQFDWVRNLMLNFPELVFLLVLLNVLLGRWTGLRLLEFVRFKEIIRNIEEE